MREFCVYLTIYSGNKLPPFYIGSTYSARLARGYVGSVVSKRYKAIWKSERFQNPHLFRTVVLATFETREAAFDKERSLQKRMKVIENRRFIPSRQVMVVAWLRGESANQGRT